MEDIGRFTEDAEIKIDYKQKRIKINYIRENFDSLQLTFFSYAQIVVFFIVFFFASISFIRLLGIKIYYYEISIDMAFVLLFFVPIALTCITHSKYHKLIDWFAPKTFLFIMFLLEGGKTRYSRTFTDFKSKKLNFPIGSSKFVRWFVMGDAKKIKSVHLKPIFIMNARGRQSYFFEIEFIFKEKPKNGSLKLDWF